MWQHQPVASKRKTKKNATIFIHSQINSETHQKWHFIRHFVAKENPHQKHVFLYSVEIHFILKIKQDNDPKEREKERTYLAFLYSSSPYPKSFVEWNQKRV